MSDEPIVMGTYESEHALRGPVVNLGPLRPIARMAHGDTGMTDQWFPEKGDTIEIGDIETGDTFAGRVTQITRYGDGWIVEIDSGEELAWISSIEAADKRKVMRPL